MEKAKQELIEKTEHEISRGKIFIAFYKQKELKQNKEEAAKTKLKRIQIEDAQAMNAEMLEFFKNYAN